MPAMLKTLTIGCKVNQYETEFVRQGLARAGFVDAADDAPADLCIVNTCTVTAEGDAKSRQAIRRMAKENPTARIVVMGCYATRAPDEVARLPGVVEVVTDKRELPDLLARFGVADVPSGVSDFGPRHRAWIKVQDGCLLRCSFCIIPLVRPHLASRPPQQILDEIRRLVAHGYRELVLVGIHLGHYGVEWNRGRAKAAWTRLSHLLSMIVRLPGEFRVRLSSIEATEVTGELIEVMAQYPQRICPHLHVSMQSGSDGVLRRMHRRWGSRRFVDRCRLVQRALDRPALTTDVIVGFPGESAADFSETLAVSEEVGFSKIHVFPFSARRGTPAADMPDQVTPQVKADRARRLAQLDERLRQRYYETLVGRTLRVLVQHPSAGHPGYVAGPSCRYAEVALPGTMALDGQLVEVEAEAVVDGRIRAAGPRCGKVS